LAYFGDDFSSVGASSARDLGCGNCDNCLTPPATWDGTEAAQKLLSAVYRTHQRFGAAHIVDVLLGNATEKVTRNHHDTLSVFGIGTELTAQSWRSVIRQLIVREYLRVDHDRYGALRLTGESRRLLRGEIGLRLREDPKEPVARKKAARSTIASSLSKETLTEEDRVLWEALRECRRRIAAEQGLPPYVIFHDATLLAMVEHRPESAGEMLALSGVGKTKLERYGTEFLELIRGVRGR